MRDSIRLFAMHPPLSLVSINMPYRLQISDEPLKLMEWCIPADIPSFPKQRDTLFDSSQCILLCLFHWWFTSLIDSGLLSNLWNLWNDGLSWYSVPSKPYVTLFDFAMHPPLCLSYLLTCLIDSRFRRTSETYWMMAPADIPSFPNTMRPYLTLCNASSPVSSIDDSHPSSTPDFFQTSYLSNA